MGLFLDHVHHETPPPLLLEAFLTRPDKSTRGIYHAVIIIIINNINNINNNR